MSEEETIPLFEDETVSDEENAEDYKKYRGKCREMSEALVAENPALTLVRGHYLCPFWGEQAHWWCKDAEGNIVDPTARQFPSKGNGLYVEFDGFFTCENCGKRVAEEDAVPCGRYPTCSQRCAMRLVGL
jgi:hypothetical protein